MDEEEKALTAAERDQVLADWDAPSPPVAFAARVTAQAIRPRKRKRAIFAAFAAVVAAAAVMLAVVWHRRSESTDRAKAQAAAELEELKRINQQEKAEAEKIAADIQAIQGQIANASESDRQKLAEQLRAKERERMHNAMAAENARGRVRRGAGSAARKPPTALDLGVGSGALDGVKGK